MIDEHVVGLRLAFAVTTFSALTFCTNAAFAEEQPDAVERAATDAAQPVDQKKKRARLDAEADQGPVATKAKEELAAELANPTAAVMSMRSLLDVTYYRGDAPGARKASFTYSFQPALPFMTKNDKGNLIFRPLIPVQFGQPYINTAGTVDSAVSFGNISLDSIYGKTFSNGLMVLGGVATVFPTASKPELRADWAFGPEAMIGRASKRFIFGVIVAYTWSFPAAPKKQTVSGQYFWWINLDKAWQVGAGPTFSYSRESRVTQFPIGLGFRKVLALGKKKQPLQVGAEAWLYAAQADALGPQWTLRITVAPVIPIPWGKM
jgi:hypothetical protein